jgi:hypothetical protein
MRNLGLVLSLGTARKRSHQLQRCTAVLWRESRVLTACACAPRSPLCALRLGLARTDTCTISHDRVSLFVVRCRRAKVGVDVCPQAEPMRVKGHHIDAAGQLPSRISSLDAHPRCRRGRAPATQNVRCVAGTQNGGRPCMELPPQFCRCMHRTHLRLGPLGGSTGMPRGGCLTVCADAHRPVVGALRERLPIKPSR